MADLAPAANSETADKPWRRDPIWLNALSARRLDLLRGFVTSTLMITFAGTLGFAAWVTVSRDSSWQHVKEYINLALPAITGLLGSAMGFYFGSSAGAAAAAVHAAIQSSEPKPPDSGAQG